MVDSPNEERSLSLFAKSVGYLIRAILRLILLTCHFRVRGGENIIKAKNRGSTILMMWHNRILMIGPSLLKATPFYVFCAFISKSRDGDIASAYTTSYKNGRTVRVPHNAKAQALQILISVLQKKQAIAIMTPDGPRGPLYQMKPGVAIAAKASDAAIIPFSWTANRFWELKSWDKMRIPMPFSSIQATFGEPIVVDKSDSYEEELRKLKESLDFLN